MADNLHPTIKKKVFYILSNIDKSLGFEWLIEEWPHERFHLTLVLLNPGDSRLSQFASERNISVIRFQLRGKKDYPVLLFQLVSLLRKERPDIVHAHLLDAGLLGMTAAWLAGVERRIYTRHHGSFHHDYYPKGVWLDQLTNWLATDLVAISENVRSILISEGVPENKIHKIRHGFKIDLFANPDPERVARLREKYNPDNKRPVVGVIARFFELKGIQYIIPAFQQLLQQYPEALLLLANARGPYEQQLNKLLLQLPEGSWMKIPFETDLVSFYALLDIHIHTPVNPNVEAFGQTYIEALAAGVPSVFTNAGVAPELIRDGYNAVVVPFKSTKSIFSAILGLLGSKETAFAISANGKNSVSEFEIGRMKEHLVQLYENHYAS